MRNFLVPRRALALPWLAGVFFLSGCSGPGDESNGPGTGGAGTGALGPESGGVTAAGAGGAANGRGGETPGTGGVGAGGVPGGGGSPQTGGSVESGGATPSGGATASGGVPGDCHTPPPASELVGWATVSGALIGGGDAAPITVTTLSGLLSAAAGNTPAVIHVDGVLNPGSLSIGSNKTIVGVCGAEIHGRVEIKGASNVIVRNIKIVGFGVGDCALDPAYDSSVGCSSGSDAVSVRDNAHHIWFDHCDISDGTDGNLDITNGSNYVTVSWTKFHYTPRTDPVGDDSTGDSGHRFSNLVGSTDDPTDFDDANALNVTWHHNWWADNVVQRQPRVRFGQNHVFNNLYSSAEASSCVRAGTEAAILLEGNYFAGVDGPHGFNSDTDQGSSYITADASNVYDGTSGARDTGGGGTPFTDPPYAYTVESASEARAAIESGAGPH